MEKEKGLNDALTEAQEIEKALGAIDEQDEKPIRKMRFADDGTNPHVGQGVGINKTDIWLKKPGIKQDMSLEELTLARMILQSRDSILPDELESRWQSMGDKVKRYTMTEADSGIGAELTDTILWSGLFRDVTGGTAVAQLFTPFIQMTSGKMELSELGDSVFYKPAGEGQAVTATDLSTAKRSFNAYLLKSQVDLSDELDEDALIAMIPEVRNRLIRNAQETIDSVILNGDTTTGATNINYYGGDIGTTSRFLIGFNGLIHYSLIEMASYCLKDMSGAPTVALMNEVLGKLGKYGLDPKQVAFICDQDTWAVLRGVGDFLTVDKAGASATLKTGQVPTPFGSPMVVSTQLAKSAAGGYVHYTTNTKGRFLAVNTRAWKVGFRRSVKVAIERSEAKGLTSIVASFRMALQCLGDRTSAGYTHTILGYDGTV